MIDILKRPVLSIVVIVYRMPEQAKRTLHSLSMAYQQNVRSTDYEVIVVENDSDKPLGEKSACQFGPNFRYFYRKEHTASPVWAINYGVEKAKGRLVAIMIDGARMVTPGVIQFTLAAEKIGNCPVVALPGYHLGCELQQHAVESGYDQAKESELLKSINWPEDGYRLFEIACLSGTSANGFFKPIAESNFICIPKSLFNKYGKCDTRFDRPGGGFANLDLYRRLCELPETTLYILPGEGSFHQFHEGATTGGQVGNDRESVLDDLRQQYFQIRDKKYAPPTKPAVYIGSLNKAVQRFVHFSAERMMGETKK